MAEFMMRSVSAEVLSQLSSERETAGKAFHEIGRRYQYSETGGAPLLGIDGVCTICHGSSNALTITNALKGTKIFQDKNINAQIIAELEEVRL
jgi:glycerol-3-phosphate acyltransferase PlsX